MVDIVFQNLTKEELDAKPWKYYGYKAFAHYMATDDDYFALRRFDRFHTRLLLYLQDQVTQVEEQLDTLDGASSLRQTNEIDNGCFRSDLPERTALYERGIESLIRYGDLLSRFHHLKHLESASDSNVGKVKRWLENRSDPIQPQEVEFLKAGDLVSLSNSKKSPLRRLFERAVLARILGLHELFAKKPPATSRPITTAVYGQDKPVDTLATIAILFTAFLMLITPMWILATLKKQFAKLGTITAFMAVFTLVLSLGTLARPFEVFAATAGYCAVLVVFLQLGSTACPGV